MPGNVVPFTHPHATRTRVNAFVRVGSTHRVFGDLVAQGHLRCRRAVFEASRTVSQADVISTFKAEGGECVLDTCAAELSAASKCGTHVKNSGWLPGAIEGPLRPEFFDRDMVCRIADFVIEGGFDAVLSPAHFLDCKDVDWLPVDLDICNRLRVALDARGGGSIAIDYPLILNHTSLTDDARMSEVLEGIAHAPVENVWLRLSGMGKDLGPNKSRRIIRSLQGMQNLGHPIVMDYAGGLAGLLPVVFGLSSGVSTGILALDSFDASEWHKPPKPRSESDSFRRGTRFRVPGLQRTLSEREFTLLAEARGGASFAVGD